MTRTFEEWIQLMDRAWYAIHRFEHLRRNPLNMQEAAPLIRKGLKHTKAESKGLKTENQKRQREAAAKYEEIRKFAGQVIAADPKLRSANRLAIKIHKLRPEWKERTIRRALVPKKSLATRSVWPSPFPRYGSSQEEAVHCKKPSENAKNRRQNSCSN